MGKKGFTLTELLIVIAVLAILAVVAVPVVVSVNEKAGLHTDRITAQSVETAIEMWMNTDYSEDGFLRTNLYSSVSDGEPAQGRIGGLTEQMYSYEFAGTKQLPGIELTEETEIRHAVITAVKATSDMKLVVKSGEQFILPPKAGSHYGFKYYYKIGKVSVEKDTQQTLENEDIYNYFVWLDKQGGNISGDISEKRRKNQSSFDTAPEALCAFSFNLGERAADKVSIEIKQGEQVCTVKGVNETARMFKPGVYTLNFYYMGEKYKTIVNFELTVGSDTIDAK